MGWFSYRPYVSVSQRRANSVREMNKLAKKGQKVEPVMIEGRTIAKTFWGKAWCDHIEQLADFESRLDRGKTYVRNGSVCHLAISRGKIDAIVCGSSLYKVKIGIEPLQPERWNQMKKQCAGQMTSVVELLQGKFSDATMKILTGSDAGMFPMVEDFDTDCNCPDYVRLCKHLAAVLYGVGARLDVSPELIFTLRGVDPTELLQSAATFTARPGKSKKKTIESDALSDVFGIDLAPEEAPKPARPGPASKPKLTPKKSMKKSTKKAVKPKK